MIKTCAKCGGEFIPQKITSKYCSRECYLAANKEGMAERWKRQHAKAKMQGAPSESDFDLKEGDIIYGPDRQLDGDKRKIHKYKVTKVYPHIFEAVRLDKGWERSFTKADYITGEVRKEEKWQKQNSR